MYMVIIAQSSLNSSIYSTIHYYELYSLGGSIAFLLHVGVQKHRPKYDQICHSCYVPQWCNGHWLVCHPFAPYCNDTYKNFFWVRKPDILYTYTYAKKYSYLSGNEESYRHIYRSPSILQPSILRPPLIIRPLDLVPKGSFLC